MYKIFFLASGLLIAGFTHNSHAQEPENLHLIKKKLAEYHDDGSYIKDIEQVVANARKYLALRITENNNAAKRQKLAIVLDIDETVLTNYHFMKGHSFGGTLKEFDDNIARHQLPAIKPMQQLYQFAQKNQVAVFFVTGRKERLRAPTQANLKASGFNQWQHVYFKPNNYQQTSAMPFKAAMRKAIAEKGYTIVESIGDQVSDLKGGYAEKTFKLPNPYYYIP